MNSSQPIAFLDSGIGGLPYLEKIRRSLPNEGFVYLADNAAFPYGEKTPDEIREIVVRRVGGIIETWRPKVIVIACNTASVIALAALRSAYRIPFVGVVPAVKPAAMKTAKGRIGLLATNGTIVDTYTDDLIDQFASSCTVMKIPDPGLADFVEKNIFRANAKERAKAIEPIVRMVQEIGLDTLIIGCTHFVYIEDDLKKAFGENVVIIDSTEGVTRQVVRVVEKSGLAGELSGIMDLYITGAFDQERYDALAKRFSLNFGGVRNG
jgi:glutamate racemase